MLYSESWWSCLYVNFDFRLLLLSGDTGDEPANGAGDDMMEIRDCPSLHLRLTMEQDATRVKCFLSAIIYLLAVRPEQVCHATVLGLTLVHV